MKTKIVFDRVFMDCLQQSAYFALRLIDIILPTCYNLITIRQISPDRSVHIMKKRLLCLLLAVLCCVSLLAIPALAQSEGGAVTTTALNLRKEANTSSDIILTMPQGAQLIVISTANGWSKVNYNGTVAYACSQYLSARSSVSGSFGTAVVTGDDVRMRSGPGTGHSIICDFDKGTRISVTGASGGWYAITVDGKSGYMSSDYISFLETASVTNPTKPPQPTAAVSNDGYAAEVIGTSVRLRQGPGTGYGIIGYCSKGADVTVYSSENGWYKLGYNGKVGYMSGDYVRISPKETYSPAKSASMNANGVNLRMGPSTDDFSSIKKIGKSDKLSVTGAYGDWYQVSVGGSYGYVYSEFVNIGAAAESTPQVDKLDGKLGTVTGNGVRLRSGPGTSYSVIGYYNRGVQFTVTGKSGDWYQVTSGNVSGYMSASYITLSAKNDLGEQIAKTALQYLGVPYVYGGTSPRGFDCSGLCYYVYQQYGYSLYRGATSMWNNNGVSVDKADLQPGDLVFFKDSTSPIGHVGMYIGDGKFVHAASGKGKVIITELDDSSYYQRNYVGAKRIIGS